jgi:PleD family two-component response regulator/EAL domain-containing protein (putative c-di-GMP-specific phosphodiesterase class I)
MIEKCFSLTNKMVTNKMSNNNSKTSSEQLEHYFQTLKKRWQDLLSQGWSKEKAELFFDTTHYISELSEKNSEYNELSDCALSLEVYLSSLVEYDFIKNEKQVIEVNRLIKHLIESGKSFCNKAEEPKKSWQFAGTVRQNLIYVLQNQDLKLAPWQDKNYQFVLTDSIADLMQLFSKEIPAALILDAAFTDKLHFLPPLAKQIRETHRIRLPILFIISNYTMQQRLEIMRIGADGHFLLPLSNNEVTERIERLLAEDAPINWKVMIIDDDPIQAKFAQRILHKANMQTLIINNPLQALNHLEQFHPDLILMDIYMPECSGVELTQIIREDEKWLNTPIIFLSGEHDPDKQFDALSVGGDDFLAKPISPKHLLSSVSFRMQRIMQVKQHTAKQNAESIADALSQVNKAQNTNSQKRPIQKEQILNRKQFLLVLENKNIKGSIVYWKIDETSALVEKIGIDNMETIITEIIALLRQILGKKTIISHFSDYAFFILLPTKVDTISVLIKNILKKISNHLFQTDSTTITLTVSAGAYELRQKVNKDQWLAHAMSAAKDAEKQGGNRMVIYQPKIQLQDTHNAGDDILLELIQTAVDNNYIKVFYQPIVSLHGENREQYNISIQIEDTAGEILDNKKIRATAKKYSISKDVDNWLTQHLLQIIETQHKANHAMKLFISLSIETIMDNDYFDALLKVDKYLRKSLIFEFNYQDLIEDMKCSVSVLERLHKIQIQTMVSGLALQDKGLMVLLKNLPVDYVGESIKSLHNDELLTNLSETVHGQNKKLIISDVDDARDIIPLWSANIGHVRGQFLHPPVEELDFDFSNSNAM